MLEIQIMNRHGEGEIASSKNIGSTPHDFCQLPLIPSLSGQEAAGDSRVT